MNERVEGLNQSMNLLMLPRERADPAQKEVAMNE
jgi:hypothetical protein